MNYGLEGGTAESPYSWRKGDHQMLLKNLVVEVKPKGGVSDANSLVGAGVPTLDSLGPIGGGMHDLNREYLRIDSLPVRGALLAGLIHRLSLSESTGKDQTLDQ